MADGVDDEFAEAHRSAGRYGDRHGNRRREQHRPQLGQVGTEHHRPTVIKPPHHPLPDRHV
ncbi:hypothetical protein Pflav_066070 [Phytohabitans flavus]|uniref:Uncharacterized protein n=1 Tax=Phytohabitans flavus TaxID=1076124 RepID=A0A6F8Y2B9_9ACTN|nr:hypothetical protein Pflav_066070 [Phytohabitans flavus]